MKKKLCEIGARIHCIKSVCDELDVIMTELIHEVIDENPDEMMNILIELIKDKNELL